MRGCLAVLALLLASFAVHAADEGEKVVLIVWDGLRPDSVNEKDTPNLAKLAARGVFFANHHASILASTEVNGTVLATGCHPARSSVIANVEFRPEIEPTRGFNTEHVEEVRKGDGLTGGKYLKVPTVPEILRKAGRPTAVAGTKPVAFLFDRAERTDEEGAKNPVLFQSRTLPASLAAKLKEKLGAFPPPADSTKAANSEEDLWTTRALLETLWQGDAIPDYSVLWLSEADYAQHGAGPGSAPALAGLKSNDELLGRVLERLEAAKQLGRTNILIVSDHGFSTIVRAVSTPDALVKAGFTASKDFLKPPQKGDILVVGHGGAIFFYVTQHDAETIEKLVDFLQGLDYAGTLFTREAKKGTFALADVHLESEAAPDVAMGMKWSNEKNEAGVPGTLVTEGAKRKPGQGNHASLSPYELRNTLIAAGPSFKQGVRSTLPSGNLDVAPTVLAILGEKGGEAMDGRVLEEALAKGKTPEGEPATTRLETSRETGHGVWKQYLKVTTFAGKTYVDEGGAELTPKP
ncbi:MAG: alkaline phosphatase family protein [Planctomycetota bacterium]|nr:alkaline phosphatase family protein [Planctomycetota bacterium]